MSAPHIMIVAGETSGDLLGADLIEAIRALYPDAAFSGVGGPAMIRAGFSSLFDMSEIAIMGLGPILANLRRLFGLVGLTAAHAFETRPDIVVLIDSPEFNHRVAARIKKRYPDICVICYVAPSVWAWRRGRARKMAQHFDAVLSLFPFESHIFKALSGPPCHFVGHPIVDRFQSYAQGADFRAKYNIPGEERLLCVLPGSRMSEIRKLAPVFEQTIARVAREIENLSVVVPVVPHTSEAVRARVAGWPIQPILVEDESDKIAAFSAANAALAASGTATLELGMAGLPSVVAYKMGGMMGPLLLRMLRVPSAVIVNLVLDAPVMEEFLEDRCRADLITPAVNALLQDDALNSEKRAQLLPLADVLGGGGQSPATRAAEIIRSLIRQD
ncbi:MAG: lipid-A-disaccharide synthase [Pseudomonadota bacterium]|nr:lipid-A-disaccharide synthase [Pseudomonadota bacterium]